MKPRYAHHRIAALTLTEVLVVIAALVLLAAIFITRFGSSQAQVERT